MRKFQWHPWRGLVQCNSCNFSHELNRFRIFRITEMNSLLLFFFFVFVGRDPFANILWCQRSAIINGTLQTDLYCLISYRAGAWHYRIFPEFLKSPFSKWRIVGVKTRTKAFFFEEILINIPSENLSKLSKERMQYFCHALKLNLRSQHSASASNCSMNRSLEPNMIINFLQQRILCLILPAYEK